MWAPILADPPLAKLNEMEDGTYNLCDLLDLNKLIIMKNEQIKKAQTHGNNN